jgi:hypothetical protein
VLEAADGVGLCRTADQIACSPRHSRYAAPRYFTVRKAGSEATSKAETPALAVRVHTT